MHGGSVDRRVFEKPLWCSLTPSYKEQEWGKYRTHTGMFIMGASPKYDENNFALNVALMRIKRRSGLRGSTSRMIIRRKSSFIPRSWISSTIT